VRLPVEIKTLLQEGASLPAADAEALERGLEQRPDDFTARARLVGYYEARTRAALGTTFRTRRGLALTLMPEDIFRHEALARHALWLAAHAPRSALAAHPLLQFSMNDPAYAELSSTWRRQVGTAAADSTVFANAITFFWWSNEIFADELLSQAEALFPGDERWSSFRRRRRAQELEVAVRLQPLLRPRSPIEGSSAPGKGESPETRLDEMDRLLREEDPQSEWVPRLREIAGELAFTLGRLDKARAYAGEMIARAGAPDHGDDAVHNGHLLLGRIALREGDTARASAHLILAGQAGATGLLPVFGPDMRLAAELVASGDREGVIRYLSLCRAFWLNGQLDDWIAQLRAGEIPDFSRNLRGLPS
jgi:hypothetical protein